MFCLSFTFLTINNNAMTCFFFFFLEFEPDIFHVSIQSIFFFITIKYVESEYFSFSDAYIETKI